MSLAKGKREQVSSANETDFQCPKCGRGMSCTSQGLPVHSTCPDCGVLLWCRKQVERDSVVLDVISGTTPEIPDMATVGRSLQQSGTMREVVVNLSRLETVNSSFVAGLLVMRRLIEAAGGKLVLCDLRPRVRAILQRLNLYAAFVVRS